MRNPRLWAYVAVLLALAGLGLVVPHVWATSGLQGGTVPTPTRPGRPQPTSIVPTPDAGPTQPSDDSGGSTGGQAAGPATTSPATAAPTTAAAGTPTATIIAPLELTVLADPPLIWPGTSVHMTATLRNTGTVPIQQIVMTNTLSAGLVPGMLPPGSMASWSGRELRLELPLLAPAQEVPVQFSATVESDIKPGAVLQTVALASAGSGQKAFVQTLLPLRPAELPRTGSRCGFGC